MPIKTRIAALATPVVRLLSLHIPPARRNVWRRLIYPYFAWRDYQYVAKTQFGSSMKGTTSDVIQRYIYYFGIWEPHVGAFLRARLKSGETFVDVGANVGYFTLLGAKLVGPKGRVVAIEAASTTMEQLRANVGRNRVDGIVRCVHAAASDREGTTVLYAGQTGNLGTASIVREKGNHAEAVPCAPLDRLLTPQEIESVRVIKIDVEGAEALVFEGMKSILARLRPDAEIVMEIIPELSGQETVMGVFAREGWNAYALRPEDSIDNYFQPIKACAERIVDSVTVRTDVVFSRVATKRIIYDS